MDPKTLIGYLQQNAQTFCTLVQALGDEQARTRPTPESWSIVEVLCHLADEETEDFRAHLDLVLHHPDGAWPQIDPQAWVTERRYNDCRPDVALQRFLEARTATVVWLRRLQQPDWQACYASPWGSLRAGDLLASWVAHDLLHMRQLLELRWAHLARIIGPYSSDYAGGW